MYGKRKSVDVFAYCNIALVDVCSFFSFDWCLGGYVESTYF